MVNSNAKGARRERELVNRIDETEWAVLRIPASGSATDRDLPDVLFGRDGTAYAAEVKASGGDPIYLDGEEVAALDRFANAFGATPIIASRFDRDTDWGLHPLPALYETDGGNYRVKREASERAPSLDDVLAADVEVS